MPYIAFFIALGIVIFFGLWSDQRNKKVYKKQSEKSRKQTNNNVKRVNNHLRRVK